MQEVTTTVSVISVASISAICSSSCACTLLSAPDAPAAAGTSMVPSQRPASDSPSSARRTQRLPCSRSLLSSQLWNWVSFPNPKPRSRSQTLCVIINRTHSEPVQARRLLGRDEGPPWALPRPTPCQVRARAMALAIPSGSRWSSRLSPLPLHPHHSSRHRGGPHALVVFGSFGCSQVHGCCESRCCFEGSGRCCRHCPCASVNVIFFNSSCCCSACDRSV